MSELEDIPVKPRPEGESLIEGGDQTPMAQPFWFDTAKGNLLQFLGIVTLSVGTPMIFFDTMRLFGIIFCPLGLALYGIGRFTNWYFWYRLQ